ncbi:MAG: SulP family inorganic anion transporter [Actinomycetota bacterium]|nr:SulP family inorganic anion transporter [Actinomycetota bacterium]
MRRNPKRDIVAGVTVAFVALPLALAFGVASGMGAAAGLVTAIVAGFVAAVFGGSNLQVSGPTGAMTVVLLPIVAQFGGSGVLVVGIMAGILLIVLAFVGAGRYMQYIPLPVVEGFTLGIAVIIGLQQVPAALGVPAEGEKVVTIAISAAREWLAAPDFSAVLITIFVAGSMLLTLRFRPGLPVSLIAVAISTVVVAWGGIEVVTIGAIPTGLPTPALPAVPWGHLTTLMVPAVAVAALAALESLLCAAVADAMSVGERHNPNRELFGQGLANLVAPVFGGVPATAAIARTAVNVRGGARSRLGAMTQSAALLLVILVASKWVSYIPLAALAGVLLATVVQMVEISNLRALLKATRGDAMVLIATAAATIALDLVTAVVVGLVVASLYALRQMSKSARLDEVPLDIADHSAEEQALLNEHVIAYRLDGPLFFGAAHRFLLEVAEVSDVRVVILRMSRVQTLDATGARVLGDTIKTLEGRGITVLLSGIQADHENIFEVLGVYGHLAHENHIFASTPEAIAHAHAHIHKTHTHANPMT